MVRLSAAEIQGKREILDPVAPDTFSHMATRNWFPVKICDQDGLTMMVSFMDSELTRIACNAVKHFLLSTPEDDVKNWCVEMSEHLEKGTLSRELVDDTNFVKEMKDSSGVTVTAVMNLPWSLEKPEDIYPICFILRMC